MAAISHLDIGDVWKPQASFTVAGTPTDPTTLTTRLLAPDGTLTTASYSVATLTSVSTPVAKSTTGTFVYSVSLDQAGRWYVRFEGTGAAVAAEDSEAIVDPTPFYDDGGLSETALISLGEAKDFLAQRLISTQDDARIVDAINAASEEISKVAGREFKGPAANETRRFPAMGTGYAVHIGDLKTASTTSTTISVSQLDPETSLATFASTDYSALPFNRKSDEPVTRIQFLSPVQGYFRWGNVLDIDGYWGFPSVPQNIKYACKVAVAYWLDVDTEHFRQDLAAIPGGSEGGQTVFLGSPPTVFSLPPEAYRIAVRYQRKLVMS